MNTLSKQDQLARAQAINTHESFIVTAPAGSGKTELLTQRILALLAKAEQPEQILAITFTKKAAAEMTARVIKALHDVKAGVTPSSAHQQLTHELAQNALKRDQQLGWQLVAQPSRLNILTIDAFCQQLCQQLPLESGLSFPYAITEDASSFYQQTVTDLLLSRNQSIQQISLDLLAIIDNNVNWFSELLCQLLAKRDHWLPIIIPHIHDTSALKTLLQNTLVNICDEALQALSAAIDKPTLQQLWQLYQYSQDQEHRCMPPLSADYIEDWQAVSNWLLKKDNSLRQQFDKRQGFAIDPKDKPNYSKAELIEYKQHIIGIVTGFGDDVAKTWLNIKNAPSIDYQADDWQVLEKLIILLPIAYAQLQQNFHRQHQYDFTEISLAALRCLGLQGDDTSLMVKLNRQIQHILIDEYQDTSTTQYQLLCKLTEHWQPEEARSVFLVGDPMQSIYRFRNADVNLFLRIQQQGLPNIHLTPIFLYKNFRSSDKLIHWFNQHFQQVFSPQPDLNIGAVSYNPSEATIFSDNQAVFYYRFEDSLQEAQAIAEKIAQILNDTPDEKIAVLARSKSQLLPIIDALKPKHLDFKANDIYGFLETGIAQDLLALCRALLFPEDSIAWLSVLRAPWCALKLADLLQISTEQAVSWSSIQQYDKLNLSEDAKSQLANMIPAITQSFADLGTMPFSECLLHLWQRLNPYELPTWQQACVAQFFTYLSTLDSQIFTLDIATITQGLAKRFVTQDNPDARIELMTIHKSKGLEFDHVFLPGLEKRVMTDSRQLFSWLERTSLNNDTQLLLAPFRALDKQEEPIHDYIRGIEQQKSQQESLRLFYVACTRAKGALYFSACFDHESPSVGSNTFLSQLEITRFSCPSEELRVKTHAIDDTKAIFLKRYCNFKLNVQPTKEIAPADHTLDAYHAAIGSVLHEILARLPYEPNLSLAVYKTRLAAFNVASHQLESGYQDICRIIQQNQSNPTFSWIMQQARTGEVELPITHQILGKTYHSVIDCTFVAEGKRWIIDYKSSERELSQIALQETHLRQLERYGKAILALYPEEGLPLQLAVYFLNQPGYLLELSN